MRRYLVHFAVQVYKQFRYDEFRSLAELYKVKYEVQNLLPDQSESDYWTTHPVVEICTDNVSGLKQVASRSVLIKTVLEVWAHGCSTPAVISCDFETRTSDLWMKFYPQVVAGFEAGEWKSWRVTVDVINKKISMKYKWDIVDLIANTGFDLPGVVSLKTPELELFHIEYWEYDASSGCVSQQLPTAVYFGKLVATGMRDDLAVYDLSKRIFIGNTSMDVSLAFIMCNLAKVFPGDLVLDPYVGTGSILVAAAHYGAFCLGQDIDYMLLNGLGKSTNAKLRGQLRPEGESIMANFIQYGFPHLLLGCFVGDASQIRLWKEGHLFDAVVTDPPYGIRERSRKIRQRPDGGPKKPDANYYPPKEHYSLGQGICDLLNFSVSRLLVGHRLVFWYPVVQVVYNPENGPRHPCMRLVCDCELPMTCRTSRRLICMEKTRDSNGSEDIATVDDSHDHNLFRKEHMKTDDEVT